MIGLIWVITILATRDHGAQSTLLSSIEGQIVKENAVFFISTGDGQLKHPGIFGETADQVTSRHCHNANKFVAVSTIPLT